MATKLRTSFHNCIVKASDLTRRKWLAAIGAIGALAFALSGLPQAIQCVRVGNAQGLAHGTVALWLIGEAAMLIYALGTYRKRCNAGLSDWILLANYGGNLLIVGVIAWYRWLG